MLGSRGLLPELRAATLPGMPAPPALHVQHPNLNGPGKYDAEATAAREACEAEGVVLIVHNGKRGHGFEVHLPLEALACLPDVLRDMANQTEAQLRAAGIRSVVVSSS